MQAWRWISGVLVAALLLAAASASAADNKADREREQLKRLQQMQRKLEQEKSQLAQEKAALDGQLKETQEKLDETGRKAQSAAVRAAALGKELAGVKAEKEALSGKLAETEKKLAETSDALGKSETSGRQLSAGLQQKTQGLATCEAKNEKLHGYGTELLDRYEKKGCGDAMLQGEPFTQLKRVEIENLVEDYREKLDEQKLDRSARR